MLTGGFIPAAAQSNALTSVLGAGAGSGTCATALYPKSNLGSSLMGTARAASRWSENSDKKDVLLVNANAKVGSELTGASRACFFARTTKSVAISGYAEGVAGGAEVEGAGTAGLAGAEVKSLTASGAASFATPEEKLKDEGAEI